jgi:hypothetical protein
MYTPLVASLQDNELIPTLLQGRPNSLPSNIVPILP